MTQNNGEYKKLLVKQFKEQG